MPIEALLFDKDGTLIDFDATFGPATFKVIETLAQQDEKIMLAMANAAEFDLNSTAITRSSFLLAGSLEDIGKGWFDWAQENEALSDFVARIDNLYVRYSLETVAPFEFLGTTLKNLAQRGLLLGVGTNDSEAGAKAHLEKINAIQQFQFVAGYDSGHGAKPAPGMVLAFADSVGVPIESVAMVGDTLHDCMAGRAAGAITIGVTSGQTAPEVLRPFADYILDDISQIPALLDSFGE